MRLEGSLKEKIEEQTCSFSQMRRNAVPIFFSGKSFLLVYVANFKGTLWDEHENSKKKKRKVPFFFFSSFPPEVTVTN